VVEYEYDSWGNILKSATINIAPSNLDKLNVRLYSSYWYDDVLGLYFLKTRLYDPELGRFLSKDSELIEDSTLEYNPYLYCANNPVNRIDPDGRISWDRLKSAASSAWNWVKEHKPGRWGILLISGELLADLDPYYVLITAGVVTIAARAFSPVVESIKKYSIPVRPQVKIKEEARTENANPQRPCLPPDFQRIIEISGYGRVRIEFHRSEYWKGLHVHYKGGPREGVTIRDINDINKLPKKLRKNWKVKDAIKKALDRQRNYKCY